jgi:hypothetical protein
MSSEGRTQSYLYTVWYQPGRTIEKLQINGAGHMAALLVAGAFGVLNSARFYFGSDDKSALWLLGGFLFGIGMLYLMAQLARNFSRWFGGQAECRIVRVGMGLALLPWTLLSGLLLYLLMSGLDAARLEAFGSVMMAGFIYGFVVFLLAMRTALGVSPWRTFASLMLAGLAAFFSITLVLSFFIKA